MVRLPCALESCCVCIYTLEDLGYLIRIFSGSPSLILRLEVIAPSRSFIQDSGMIFRSQYICLILLMLLRANLKLFYFIKLLNPVCCCPFLANVFYDDVLLFYFTAVKQFVTLNICERCYINTVHFYLLSYIIEEPAQRTYLFFSNLDY